MVVEMLRYRSSEPNLNGSANGQTDRMELKNYLEIISF